MKKVFRFIFILLIVIFCGCSKKTIYDVTPPRLLYSTLLTNNNFLLIFNEPIKSLSYFIDETLNQLEISFPKSNIEIPFSEINQIKTKNFEVTVCDTSNHVENFRLSTPIINTNPVDLHFETLQIKYTDKKPQKLTLKSNNCGKTAGYKLVMYVKNDFIELPFDDLTLSKNETMTFVFTPTKTEFSQFVINKKYNQICFEKFRLSPTCATIYILNNHDEIIDSIFYIDTKQNDFTYFESSSRAYKKIKQHFDDLEYEYKVTDVIGNTTKKIVIKQNDKYIVKK